MMIHRQALETFGLRGRLTKLRTEATEVANVIDRLDEGKASLVDVVREIWDFLFVLASITMSFEYQMAEQNASLLKHNKDSELKLRNAINERKTPK
jgi:hypothetical protein